MLINENDATVRYRYNEVGRLLGSILPANVAMPAFIEHTLEVQFFIPNYAGTPLLLVDSKGENLWEALPDDWKAAKEVELAKLLVSEYCVW
jgi:hypothetical protein